MSDKKETTIGDVERRRVIQFRLRTLLVLILAFSLLFAIGVPIRERLNRQPTVQVVVTYPTAPAESCDESIARILELAFMSSPHIESWTIVSHTGRVEAYAIAVRGTDSQDLPKQVDQSIRSLDGRLPLDAVTTPSKLFRSKPFHPSINIQQVDQLEVKFSGEALAQLGLTPANAASQIQLIQAGSSPISKQTQLALEQSILTTNQGQRIELGQVAEVSVVRKPDKVVRQSP
jgi:multidrug efflux pump subunit AcrB